MTGFEVYKMYLALKQHFTKEKYDYHKYRGKVRASEDAFEQRHDRYFFKKLATKYSQQEIVDYFVANFIFDPKGYIKSFNDDVYRNWKVNQESFSYKFKEDVYLLLDEYDYPYQDYYDRVFSIKHGKHPKLLKSYLAGEISLETLVVFETCLGFVKDFDRVLTDPIWKEVRMKIIKYQPFIALDCNVYRGTILDTIATKV